jgi:hypothetical protein
MKFSLTRTAGLVAAVAVLTAGGLASTAVASTRSTTTPTAGTGTTAVPALTPARLTYASRFWGDPTTELGIVIDVPKGWTQVKLHAFESKFTSPNKLWNVRIDGIRSSSQSLTAAANAKLAALQATPGLKVLSLVNGQTIATGHRYEGTVFHHTTLTYTYTDGARGKRLVVDRWVNIYGGSTADVEISTGGRLQDTAGLNAITARATRTYVRLP